MLIKIHMLENFILYFYLLKQTYLYFFLFFYLSTLTKKKKYKQMEKIKIKLLEVDYWASSDVVRKNL
jgi:hypothetical protein